jgi:hypothetical protein
MNVYLDESGDLGFTFNRPFRKGGSSRYLTIAFLLIPKELSPLPKRIVKKMYKRKKRQTDVEIKGSELTLVDKIFFVKRTFELLNKHSQIKIFAITVDKRNVKEHIREDPNKLYNYMIGLVLPQKIRRLKRISFIPDERSIKLKSGNSLSDYLQIKLWFELKSKTIIKNNPQESHLNLNLQFIDWITHIIWEKYENKDLKVFHIIQKKVELTDLFFPRR